MHDASVKTKWFFLEPEKGKWNWEEADKEVDSYLAQGVAVLGLLDGVGAWRTKDNKLATSAMFYPDTDFAEWENYVRSVVSHFKGRIDNWEVMNECVFWQGENPDKMSNPKWYVELLKHAYKAAKEGNPDAFIIGGGGAAGPVKTDRWLQGAIDAGIFKYCDAFSYHGYGRATCQILSGPQPLAEFMDWINGKMVESIGKTIPVWETEVGVTVPSSTRKYWFPPRDVVSTDTNMIARELLVCLLSEKAVGVSKTFLYHGFDIRIFGPSDLLIFPEVNEQFSVVPVLVGVYSSLFDGLVPAGKYEMPGPKTTLYKFTTPSNAPVKRTVWATYSMDENCKVTVQVPENCKVKVLSMFGREIESKMENGKLTVDSGALPVYIVTE